MKLRRFLYSAGAGFLFLVVFVIDAAMKNFEGELNVVAYIRGGLALLGFVLLYLLINTPGAVPQRNAVQRLGRIAVWIGLFIGLYVVISLLPLGEFESRDLRFYPRDYLTILFSVVLGVAAGTLALIIIHSLKDLLLYKKKKGTRRNYWLLLIMFAGTAVSTYNLRPLEATILTTVFFAVSVLMIVVNSFRLSWIAYLSRREKIYSMLYALLAFFGCMILSVIFQEKWLLFKALRYFSYPVQTFAQLTVLFGAVYFGMTFISTLFHLPTAEAYDRKQTELSSLHNLNKLITQVFDLNELAETVTKTAFDVCEVSGAWLEILPTDGEAPAAPRSGGIVSHRNISMTDIEAILFQGEATVRSLVLSSKKLLLVDDVAGDRRTRYIPKMKRVGSMLIIPLISHENLIGILYATKEMDYGFDQDDIDVLSGFADQVTISIENARLIKRSLEKERLQRELMLAQEMQKRLLPQRLPQFAEVDMHAVSAPALEVGGDYYDMTALGGNKVCIVIGDVSGKGVGAAFYMAEAKGIFQSLSKIHSSPKEFLIKANEALLTSIDRRSFISLIFAVLDLSTGELLLARAGHCPMLYVAADHTEYIKPTGMGLGLVSGATFSDATEEKRILLKRGDVCVLYTDGVTESRSAAGDEFGYERLAEVVRKHREQSAEEITEEIIQRVWQYTDSRGCDDDLTAFVLKWRGRS